MSYPTTRYTRMAYCSLCNVVYLFEPKHLAAHIEQSAMGRVWAARDGSFLPCPLGHAIMQQTTSKRQAPRRGYLESIGPLNGPRYEFCQMQPDGKTLLRVLHKFSAPNDDEARAVGTTLYDSLAARNITTPYTVREAGTERYLEYPEAAQ